MKPPRNWLARMNPAPASYRYPLPEERLAAQNPPDAFGLPAEAHLVPVFPKKRPKPGPAITDPRSVARYLSGLEDAPVERLVVLLLDQANRVVGTVIAAQGTINETTLHPREVFAPAIAARAVAIAIAHNHPSGKSEPSEPDIATTVRLVTAGVIVGIPVLDSLVIGAGGAYTSLAARGVIDSMVSDARRKLEF